MSIMEHETPDQDIVGDELPTREDVKRDLVEAYVRMLDAIAEVHRLFRLSEHTSINIAVRDLASTMNADDRIPTALFTTWARRRGAAFGRKQARGKTE